MHQRIGLVPQETNVYLDLSAMDNLWHHAALYCDDLSTVKERIGELLRLMKLWERRNDPMHVYSGGMKRRLTDSLMRLWNAELGNQAVSIEEYPCLAQDVPYEVYLA